MEALMVSERHIVSALRLLRFAAAGAIICAAFTGLVGMDDASQVTASAVGFGAALAAKLAHLV